jgi:hypothetical protein
MRDFKCTLGESELISVSQVCTEAKNESSSVLFDITKYIPNESVYTKEAIECGIYNLDEVIQSHYRAKLKWETLFLIFGTVDSFVQLELISGFGDDSVTRDGTLNATSKFLLGMSVPTYGDTNEHQSKWKLLLTAALDKYSRES